MKAILTLLIFIFALPAYAATDIVSDATLGTSLVSCYDLNETSGTRVDDEGNNDLTDNNTVLSAMGKLGNGADFEESTSESLSIADASQTGLDITGAFSMSTWINVEATPGAGEYDMIMGKGGISVAASNTTIQYLVYYRNDGDIRLETFFRGNAVNKTAGFTTTLSTGTWYHVIVTYEPSTAIRLYLDNVEVGTNTSAIMAALVDTARPFAIGTDSAAAATNFFDGVIDTSAVWSKVLSSGERADLYNAGAGIPCVGSAVPYYGQPAIIFE